MAININANNMQIKTRGSGFTLIEIMVVVAIIGLLAAIIAPRVLNRADDGAKAKVTTDIAAITSAIKLYRMDTFNYPSQSFGLLGLSTKPEGVSRWKGPYMELLPKDPWGHDYIYASPGTHGMEIDIYSYGADNAKGGNGINADIGSWDIK